MSAKNDRSCVTRKIHFYRIYAGHNLAGEPTPYDVKSVLEAIHGLDFKTDAPYLKVEGGFEFCCMVDELSSPQKVRFCKITRDDLPQIEHQGNLTDLELAENQGLAECVHAMFFPENIVGLEYNYNGLRVTRISEYLHAKSQNVSSNEPKFEELVERDAIEKLKHMRTVRKFSLKVRQSLFSSVEQAGGSLADTFRAARELGEAKEIGLTLSVGHAGENETLGSKLINVAKTLITFKDMSNDVISGEIKGRSDTGKMEVVDLLNAKLVAEKSIPRRGGRTSAPHKDFVYAAIEEAYNDFKDQFPSAVGVTLCPE